MRQDVLQRHVELDGHQHHRTHRGTDATVLVERDRRLTSFDAIGELLLGQPALQPQLADRVADGAMWSSKRAVIIQSNTGQF